MSDLISREKTLYRLARSAVYYFSTEEDKAAHEWAMHIVSGMPDEEPEKGHWIKQPYKSDKYVIFRCSECLHESGIGHIESKWANFCPNCGADMREREGE